MVGLVATGCDFSESVLEFEEAEVLSSALNHKYLEDAQTLDKYFTPQEEAKLIQHLLRTAEEYASSSRQALGETDGGIPRAEVEELLDRYSEGIQSC